MIRKTMVITPYLTLFIIGNNKLSGVASQKLIDDSGKIETEFDTYEMEDEDLISDKDKYSE
jgi:hypothetical protein